MKIDFEGLEKYLKSLKMEDIETDWQKPENPKLIQGNSIRDIEHFKMDKTKISFASVILYGMPFLIDALGGDLSVVVLTKKKYKLPTGRLIHAKFYKRIIENTRDQYGNYLNGYWIIPDELIKK